MRTFTAYIEWDPETRLYVGTVPGVAGAHTQGSSLDELQKTIGSVKGKIVYEYFRKLI